MSTTPTYAKGTTVPVEKSKAELDGLLGKHGASQRGVMHDEERGQAMVVFVLGGRKYRIEVPLPERLSSEPNPHDADGKALARPPGWWSWAESRRQDWAARQHEQLVRERWRGLVLLVKAKLEIVRMGVSSFEREFLADLVLPSGETAHQTIGTYMQRLLAEGYQGPLALPEHAPG